MFHLLSRSNAKTVKGEAHGFLTLILHLAPSWLSGFNVCPMASKGCAAACLNTAGMGKFSNVQAARIRKTRMFFEDRSAFMALLVMDIEHAISYAAGKSLTPVFRLNGTSDIRWETVPCVRNGVEYPNVMLAFPDVQFYDYTKIPNRRDIPANYHLTFSRSEENGDAVPGVLASGMNVAVVFAGKSLPDEFLGFPVHNGDSTDLRFLDPPGVVIGLTAKGKARRDDSGFVVTV